MNGTVASNPKLEEEICDKRIRALFWFQLQEGRMPVATFVLGANVLERCLKQFSIADGKPDKLLGLQARLKSLSNTTYTASEMLKYLN